MKSLANASPTADRPAPNLSSSAIDILARLVSFASVSSESNKEVVDYIAGYMAGFG